MLLPLRGKLSDKYARLVPLRGKHVVLYRQGRSLALPRDAHTAPLGAGSPKGPRRGNVKTISCPRGARRGGEHQPLGQTRPKGERSEDRLSVTLRAYGLKGWCLHQSFGLLCLKGYIRSGPQRGPKVLYPFSPLGIYCSFFVLRVVYWLRQLRTTWESKGLAIARPKGLQAIYAQTARDKKVKGARRGLLCLKAGGAWSRRGESYELLSAEDREAKAFWLSSST